MKNRIYRLIFIISMLCMNITAGAQQAFYVYRNDVGVNVFFTADVDSMTYSRIDTAGIEHEDYVTQEIHTTDSLYRIMLNSIDSIGFVTPETVYKPGVVLLEGRIREYITGQDSLTLIFRADTPDDILPSEGARLITTKTDNILPEPFVGQVVETRKTAGGIEVVCQPTALTDIFEQYYAFTEGEEYKELPTRANDLTFQSTGFQTISPGRLSSNLINIFGLSFGYEPDGKIPLGIDEPTVELAVTPVIRFNAYHIITQEYGETVGLTVIGDYKTEQILALAGNISARKDLKLFEIAKPIPNLLIDVNFELGLFWNAAASIGTRQTFEQEYRNVFHWEWNSKKRETLKNVNTMFPIEDSSKHTGYTSISGDLQAGAYTKVGISFIATSSLDIAEIGLQLNGGLGVNGTFVPYISDADYAKKSTDLYNQIKDSKVSLYWFYGLSAEGKLFDWSVSKTIPNFFNIPFSNQGDIASLNCVPGFTDIELMTDNNGTFNTSVNVDKTLFSPVNLGFALIDEDNESDTTYVYLQNGYSGPATKMSHTFEGKDADGDYAVYPLINYMGLDLIAEPKGKVEKEIIVTTEPYAFSDIYDEIRLYGKIPNSEDLNNIDEAGVFIGTTPDLTVETATIINGRILDDGRIYTGVRGFTEDVTYYYCSYVLADGQYHLGNIRPIVMFNGNIEVTQTDCLYSEYNAFEYGNTNKTHNTFFYSNISASISHERNIDRWGINRIYNNTHYSNPQETEFYQDVVNGRCDDYLTFLPKEDMAIDYNNYTATCDAQYYILAHITAQLSDGTEVENNLYACPTTYTHIYDKQPSIYMQNFVQLPIEPYNSDGYDMRLPYEYQAVISGGLFASEIFTYNYGNVVEQGKQNLSWMIHDGITNTSGGYRTNSQWTYEEENNYAYKYLGLNCNGNDILSPNFIMVNWNAKTVQLVGDAGMGNSTRLMVAPRGNSSHAGSFMQEKTEYVPDSRLEKFKQMNSMREATMPLKAITLPAMK